MNDLPMPSPVDDFLDHPSTQPASAALREALFQRTAAMVRRRGRIRVLAAVGAIAAVALIAATLLWLRLPGDAKPTPEQAVVPTPKPPPAQQPEMPTAVALEWQAFDAPREEKAALYRKAGDRYVEDADDLASAVRCYGQSVRAASAEELAVAQEDTWLVRALKIDEIERRKEH